MKDTFLNGLAAGSAIGAIGFLVFAIMTDFPAPQKDQQALAICLNVHPERYCRITYDGLKP